MSRGRAYLGATVMQVSALEALLHAMCFLYPKQVKKTVVYKQKRFRGKRNKFLEFKLYELINIAAELSWFPSKQFSWGGKTASITIGGFTHEIRKIRNFVHPGGWAQQRSEPLKFTKGVYGVVYEVFDVAISWLQHEVEQGILKAMKRQKRASP